MAPLLSGKGCCGWLRQAAHVVTPQIESSGLGKLNTHTHTHAGRQAGGQKVKELSRFHKFDIVWPPGCCFNFLCCRLRSCQIRILFVRWFIKICCKQNKNCPSGCSRLKLCGKNKQDIYKCSICKKTWRRDLLSLMCHILKRLDFQYGEAAMRHWRETFPISLLIKEPRDRVSRCWRHHTHLITFLCEGQRGELEGAASSFRNGLEVPLLHGKSLPTIYKGVFHGNMTSGEEGRTVFSPQPWWVIRGTLWLVERFLMFCFFKFPPEFSTCL